MKIKYPLATSTWDSKELEAMQRVIESQVFSMGREVNVFERQFAEKMGAKYCVMSNSGSSANLLMIASLFYRKEGMALKPGDEVIVPAVSWSTTYMPLQQYGLKIKFVDVDIKTLNFDLKSLSIAISEKTKIILAVNLLGNSNNFTEINKLTKDSDIIVLEDNCESLGATFEGQQTGSFGLMGTYSSFFSHHISTMEGGLTITNDEELYHIMLSLRSHGWTRHLPQHNKVTGIKSDDAFQESFKFVLPGYNLRPLELSGAIGQEQLLKLDYLVESRRENAMLFKELMLKFPDVITQSEIGKSSWFGFSLIFPDYVSRSYVIQIFNQFGIESRPIVGGNFIKNSVIQYFEYEISGELKNAELVDTNGLFIGNHHYSLKSELLVLEEALNVIFSEN